MKYQTVIGYKDTVSRGVSFEVGNLSTQGVMNKALDSAINILKNDHGKTDREIEYIQVAAYNIPKSHPSFSKERDVVRGWVGAMLDGELVLLTSYAVEYGKD